ncbi:Transketolase, C-terminal domain [Pseudobutyrivibrio sp. OR37]|nr:Transketolase, C-terminal domain [Pseudobutyrivibrio sp. OR37]
MSFSSLYISCISSFQVTHRAADASYSTIDKYKVELSGEKVAILALGDFYQRGKALADTIKSEMGFTPTLINPRFASGVDKELLEKLKSNHQVIVTLEDGIVEGGFGQKIASFYGSSDMKVLNYGLDKKFYDRYNPEDLIKSVGMSTEQIIEDIKNIIMK